MEAFLARFAFGLLLIVAVFQPRGKGQRDDEDDLEMIEDPVHELGGE